MANEIPRFSVEEHARSVLDFAERTEDKRMVVGCLDVISKQLGHISDATRARYEALATQSRNTLR